MITKKEMDAMRKKSKKSKKSKEAKKDFKNRCFMVIETLVGGDIVSDDIEKLKDDIYEIAHIGIGDCNNKHENCVVNTERLFKSFEKGGFI